MVNATIRAPRPTGGHAFPGPVEESVREAGVPFARTRIISAPGMTLRDYFACAAMQAAATNPTGADGFDFKQRARWAYEQADAMIAMRAAS